MFVVHLAACALTPRVCERFAWIGADESHVGCSSRLAREATGLCRAARRSCSCITHSPGHCSSVLGTRQRRWSVPCGRCRDSAQTSWDDGQTA